MRKMFVIVALAAYFVSHVLYGCKEEVPFTTDNTDTVNITQIAGVPINGVRIAWDYSSETYITSKGWYARMRRLSDNSLIAVYDDQSGNSAMKRSYDNGKTWLFYGNIFSSFYQNSVLCLAVNPEIYQLRNGDILAVCNNRPVKDEIVPFSISIRRSTDMGQNWTSPEIIYEGQPRWSDGCWEPTLLELPNGDVQLYFTDEGKFQLSNEQETRMMVSHDGGKSWDKTIRDVSFRTGARDGMPVPLLLEDEVIVSIESNPVWALLRPNILRTKLANPWSQQIVANSPEREDTGIQFGNNIRGAGPYIMRIPTGEVILSYQTNSDRIDSEHETVEVAVADRRGTNFSKISKPFDLSLYESATWNSVMLWDSTKIAVVSSLGNSSGQVGVCYKLGHIIPALKINNATPIIDGVLSEKEWDVAQEIFIGNKSNDNMISKLLFDDKNVYVSVLVNDTKIFSGISNTDGVNLYFDPYNTKYTSIGSKQFKITCTADGKVIAFQGKNTKWNEVTVSGIQAIVQKTNASYTIEMKVPFNFLLKTDRTAFRLTSEFLNYSSENLGYKEPIVNSNINQPNTWIEIDFNK